MSKRKINKKKKEKRDVTNILYFGILVAFIAIVLILAIRLTKSSPETFEENIDSGQIFTQTDSDQLEPGQKIDAEDKLSSGYEVDVHYAYSDGCPFCTQQQRFMDSWEEKYPTVTIYKYNAQSSEEMQTFLQLAETYGESPRGVPVTIIADQYWSGFSEERTGKAMENTIEYCLVNECEDPLDRLN